MDGDRQIFVASEVTISDLKKNDIFVEIELCLCTTLPNKNHESVTESFIDEIVANPETYNCLPLYCDTKNLLAGNYGQLTHMQNRFNGKFGTTQIGSVTDFRKEQRDNYCALIATARIPKRESDICQHLINLYENDMLFVSFEVLYVLSDTIVDGSTRFVDASDRNYIFGLTVVSHPAFEDSVALNLVAEETVQDSTDNMDAIKENKGVEDPMDNVAEVSVNVAEEQSLKTEQEVIEEVSEAVETAEEKTEAEPVEAQDNITAEETATTDTPDVSDVAEMNPVSEKETAVIAEDKSEDESEDKDDADTEDNDDADEDKETAKAEVCPCCGEPMNENPDDLAIDAAHAQIEAEVMKLRAQITQLEAQIELYRSEHEELEAIRMAKKAEELRQRQDNARMFAESQHLDLENEEVCNAIAEVNFEKLVIMSQENNKTSTAESHVAVNAWNDLAPSIALEDKYARLFERV